MTVPSRPPRFRSIALAPALLLALAVPVAAVAQDTTAAPGPPAAPDAAPTGPGPAATTTPAQRFALHGQATITAQHVFGFATPYAGANSLKPDDTRETIDATLDAGVRPWAGGEVWINGEVDQGFGLSDTLGIAGFVSGEAYKVGKASPYLRLQRAFVRQTVALGGDALPVAAAANVLRQTTTANRLVLTLGKFGVGDVFDTNAYAHDPRADFFNWALIDTGTFDYAADAWGYALGGAAEWYTGPWTLRAGLFNLSTEPNGTILETGLGQNEAIVEAEHRHTLAGRPGAIRLGVWRNHGRFENLDTALAVYRASGALPAPASLRRPADRWGGTLNAEQEITAALGLFLRAGLSDGHFETYDFTDIDRTFALGGQLKGLAWGRKDDRFGLATVVNGISAQRRAYLDAGGLGVLIGDGQLPHYGVEWIVESYYDLKALNGVDLTVDYQFVDHPGYNRDRGPAHVLGVRLHGQF